MTPPRSIRKRAGMGSVQESSPLNFGTSKGKPRTQPGLRDTPSLDDDCARALGLPEVLVLAFEPVLPRRIEDIHVEGVLESLGAVAQVAWNVQHFTGPHIHLLLPVPAQNEAQRTLKNVGELLVVVLVGRNLAALFQV